jgi:hypothetical protein
MRRRHSIEARSTSFDLLADDPLRTPVIVHAIVRVRSCELFGAAFIHEATTIVQRPAHLPIR